jgi:hypothetical protein
MKSAPPAMCVRQGGGRVVGRKRVGVSKVEKAKKISVEVLGLQKKMNGPYIFLKRNCERQDIS